MSPVWSSSRHYDRARRAAVFAVGVLVAGLGGAPSLSSAASPTIAVTPTSGSPGDMFTISGSGFPAQATVNVYWDGGKFDEDGTNSSGAFTDPQTIPSSTTGRHSVSVDVEGVKASTTFTIVGGSAVSTAVPTSVPSSPSAISPTPTPSPSPPSGGLWIPAPITPWQWMIDHAIDVNNAKDMGLTDPNGNRLNTPAPQMYDIDGFLNGMDPNCNVRDQAGQCAQGSNDAVNALHAMGKKVVCYIDTGVYENYRPDAYKFPPSVIGSPDSGWKGSYWLDIRQTSVLFPIMEARIKMCRDKGYDSIEPDEMVDYSNDSGFPLTYQDQLTYNRGIAQIAHKYAISIALKDDAEQAADLVNNFDWILDEQCYQYRECALLNPFSAAGKAVFDVEYNVSNSSFCPDANSRNYNAMRMPLNLDGGRWPCR